VITLLPVWIKKLETFFGLLGEFFWSAWRSTDFVVGCTYRRNSARFSSSSREPSVIVHTNIL